MLIGRLRPKLLLEVVHHALDKFLGSPYQNLVVGLGLFDTLEISSCEVIWFRRLLDIEPLSSDRFKYMVRVLVHNDQSIEIAGHIGVLVSFVAHIDITFSHRWDKSKGYQGI